MKYLLSKLARIFKRKSRVVLPEYGTNKYKRL